MPVSTDELRRWDADYVWHPFTPHSVYAAENPLMVVAAEGHELIDSDGRRYLDGVSSLWCNTFGHRREEIDRAIRDQLDQVAHATFLGNATAPAVRLAKRLVELTPPPLKRVFFSDNGSTAVEIAIKMAYQFWQQTAGGEQRRTFLTFRNAYHGDTLGSVSAGGIDIFHARYGGLLFDTLQAPSPCAYRHDGYPSRADAEEAAIRDFEAMVDAHAGQLAAIIVEPGVQGAAGMLTQPAGFLKRVKDAADRAGTLLIFDEVAVGFGRSGDALFACQSIGVTPDFLCLAKGLTGGYLPLAATLTTERVFQAFLGPPELGRTFFHGHTYTGNPLGAAAAHATLDIFEQTDLLPELKKKTDYFRSGLSSLSSHPNVGDIRQFGLCAGVEIVQSKDSKAAFPAKERIGMKICQACVERGVFLRPLSDVIVLVPPLTLSHAEFDRIFRVLTEAINVVLGP